MPCTLHSALGHGAVSRSVGQLVQPYAAAICMPGPCLCACSGAKLDVQLMKSGKSNERPSFSRSFVLRRLHGHVSLLDNIKYRVDLLQVTAATACSAVVHTISD